MPDFPFPKPPLPDRQPYQPSVGGGRSLRRLREVVIRTRKPSPASVRPIITGEPPAVIAGSGIGAPVRIRCRAVVLAGQIVRAQSSPFGMGIAKRPVLSP